VFVSDKYSHDEHVRASKRMLTMAGVSMHAWWFTCCYCFCHSIV
jgi:hypothetical protein